MRRDWFDRVFNIAFPVFMVIGLLLTLGAVAVFVHFIRKFW